VPDKAAGTPTGNSSLAMTPNANGRQTYRSFSYDAAPANSGYYTAPQSRIRYDIPFNLKFRADRKIMFNY
jgi:hypothetical protein